MAPQKLLRFGLAAGGERLLELFAREVFRCFGAIHGQTHAEELVRDALVDLVVHLHARLFEFLGVSLAVVGQHVALRVDDRRGWRTLVRACQLMPMVPEPL